MLKRIFLLLGLLFYTQGAQGASIETLDLLHKEGKIFTDYKKLFNLMENKFKLESEALVWRKARTLLSLGQLAENSHEKEKYFSLCQKHAERALNLNEKLAEGYYFQALCMGKLGQLKGVVNSLFMVYSFKKNMEKAAYLDPCIENGGAHRALGKFYLELPALFGRDLRKSIEHLKQAVRYGPAFADNYFFLAESYHADGNSKAAQSTLREFLKYVEQNPTGINIEQKRQQARELLKIF